MPAEPTSLTLPIHGCELHVERRGDGRPLLMLHGFSGASVDWRLIFDEPPAGSELIAPDLRGHGRSTNPSGEFTFRQCGRDLLALLDALELDAGERGAVQAIGLSGGGQALLHAVTAAPQRFDALVLVSTSHYFPEPARAIMAGFTVDTLSPDAWELMRRKHVHGDAQIRALYEHGRALKDSYDDVAFSVDDLARITARTLVVHGDRDPFYPLEIPLAMYRAIPDSRLWVLPGAGHAPIFGETAPLFRDTVLSFLRG